MQPGEKFSRVGEEVAVPGIAGPAAAVLGVDVHQVPVHVDDRHREGNVLGGKAPDEGLVLGLVVAVEAAPPVAQGVAGQHGGRAGQAVEVPQAVLIVVAVAEEVQVHPVPLPRLDPAVLPDEEGAAVVHHRVPRAGDQAVFKLGRAVDVVEGAGGAAQVGDELAVVPHAVVAAAPALGGQGQPAGREGLLIVQQLHPFGDDLEGGVGLEHLERRHREVPVEDGLGGPVLKAAFGAVFQPEEPGRQDGKAVVLPLHHRARVAAGAAGDLIELVHRQHPFCKSAQAGLMALL